MRRIGAEPGEAVAMPDYSATELQHIAAVEQLFVPGAPDKLTLFADDAVWWNGFPRIDDKGTTNHRGRDAVARLMGLAPPERKQAGVDPYDKSTFEHSDVVTLADGDWVIRQWNLRAKTRTGKDYQNTYCFVIRFDDDGKIAHLTEHWNTWLAAKVIFDNFDVEPPRPLI